jgi:hypothetical protein
MDAMNVLQDASGTINDTSSQFIALEERVTNMEDLILSSDTAQNLNLRIQSLEETLAANQALFSNTQGVIQLIDQNYDLIRSVINNQTSIEISYDLDVLKQGQGVFLDRSTPNQITISSTNQDFNIGTNYGYGTLLQSGTNIIPLIEFSNYFKHVNNGNNITLNGDLTIRLDDTNVKWKSGQRFRISFGDRIYPDVYFIRILTDATGSYPLSSPSGSSYSTTIVTLDADIMALNDYQSVIDIVCIDPSNLVFQVDLVGKSLSNNIN